MAAIGPRPKSRPAASGSAFWGEPAAAATCSAWPPLTRSGHRLCAAAFEIVLICAGCSRGEVLLSVSFDDSSLRWLEINT
jgi:hypothetical protein